MTYLHDIDPKSYPSPICPLYKAYKHNTKYLFSCPKINTASTILDLWINPRAATALLQRWDGSAHGAAGGGLGSGVI